MATSPKRIAWDACSWIAHIQKEKILGADGKTVAEDRGAMCRPVLNAAERGILEIVVSALSLVPWGGATDDAWRGAQHNVTFRFDSSEYRSNFLNEATRLLDTSRWTTVSASDTDPATPRHR